ncbi:hypothetical protein HAPAU_36550 [Halalkalicoccus paucihalophilus]|uniref:Uncharacterized protein n=1 Tax=Halalkalicoccus paucihalophilus TaxID=1008153 RepID=A0A151A9B3_9EURY|nr:hypothetical protein HAPAU_36550 [Halalkalicoccus paucihalophilus]
MCMAPLENRFSVYCATLKILSAHMIEVHIAERIDKLIVVWIQLHLRS